MANIEEMKERLENLKKEQSEVETELIQLRENELIKRYIELCNKESSITYKFKKMSLDIDTEIMKSCNHLFIIGHRDSYFDGHKSVTDTYPYCVKCGLDAKYIDRDTFSYEFLTPLQKQMINIYRNGCKGIYWKHYCKPIIATQIYRDLRKGLPNLSDEELFEHFKVAITNYENKEKIKTK